VDSSAEHLAGVIADHASALCQSACGAVVSAAQAPGVLAARAAYEAHVESLRSMSGGLQEGKREPTLSHLARVCSNVDADVTSDSSAAEKKENKCEGQEEEEDWGFEIEATGQQEPASDLPLSPSAAELGGSGRGSGGHVLQDEWLRDSFIADVHELQGWCAAVRSDPITQDQTDAVARLHACVCAPGWLETVAMTQRRGYIENNVVPRIRKRADAVQRALARARDSRCKQVEYKAALADAKARLAATLAHRAAVVTLAQRELRDCFKLPHANIV
jgi:hypothetical protein